jgi:hypothetical protein
LNVVATGDLSPAGFGYPNDPYSDSETRKGHGAYHSLVAGESVALTDSGLRADLYHSGGFDRRLPDYADVTLRH